MAKVFNSLPKVFSLSCALEIVEHILVSKILFYFTVGNLVQLDLEFIVILCNRKVIVRIDRSG